MTHDRAPDSPPGTPAGARVVADDAGRLWSASVARGKRDAAVVFACLSDPRDAARAIALAAGVRLGDVADDELRAWLQQAPRLGTLT